MDDSVDLTAPDSDSNPSNLLHLRREPFEYGLLPIPKLILTDPIQTLAPLKEKLLSQSQTNRIDSAQLSDSLQISIDQAKLILDTLASVLHSELDPFVRASGDEVESVSADLRDLILFLYIQSYKKLLPRPHKDAAAVADVWPSTSAFDAHLSALSPLQVLAQLFFG